MKKPTIEKIIKVVSVIVILISITNTIICNNTVEHNVASKNSCVHSHMAKQLCLSIFNQSVIFFNNLLLKNGSNVNVGFTEKIYIRLKYLYLPKL